MKTAVLLVILALYNPSTVSTGGAIKVSASELAANAQERKCTGRCILHNSQPNTYNEIRQCELRHYLEWPDHCKGYFVYNLCSKHWELNVDGSKRMHWVCCLH